MPLIDSLRQKVKCQKTPIGLRVSIGKDGLPVLEAHTTKQIKTLEELLKEANYDREEWEVERSKANVWHQMSTQNGLVPLWQVTAHLKRRAISPAAVAQMFNDGWKAFSRAIKWKVPEPKESKSAAGRMVLFSIPDLHLGKLCWGPETGHGNYDIKIAEQAFNEALDDLITRSPVAEQAWFVVGNDFWNTDNGKETTEGTPQDEDGRFKKTRRMGHRMSVEAIGKLLKKYPKVRVKVVAGNHDKESVFNLGLYLEAFFRKEKRVEVDNSDCDRKYDRWHNTGFGFFHGDKLKQKDLGMLVQYEARSIWGATDRFEILLGHLHQKIEYTLGGVIVRYLPSLTPPDHWHASMGYVMAEKSAMALVYDKRGLTTQIMHYPRKELFQ